MNELDRSDPGSAVARCRDHLSGLGFPLKGRVLYVFYGLCAWAGINIGLFFEVAVGRSPTTFKMAVSTLMMTVFILRVTLPFVQEAELVRDEGELDAVNA